MELYTVDYEVYEKMDTTDNKAIMSKIEEMSPDCVLVVPIKANGTKESPFFLSRDFFDKGIYKKKAKLFKEVKEPSIGRIVIYTKFGSPCGTHKPEPSPAIITKVHTDGECDLFVINPNGLYFNRTKFSQEPKAGHWSWPEIKREELK